jgi:hypothetical protein
VGEAVDSPYNVLGSTYSPVDESTLPQWAKDGLRAARKEAGYGRKVDIVQYDTEDRSESLNLWTRLMGRGMSLVGKRILTVRSGDGKSLPFDGFVSTENLNTIIIDVDSRAGLSYLYGHELGHSIQHQQPALYDKLKAEILAMAKDWKDYDARLAKVKEYNTKEKREIEFVNEFIGSHFAEPKFWCKPATVGIWRSKPRQSWRCQKNLTWCN